MAVLSCASLLAGAVIFAGGGPAGATTPPYEPDPQATGTLALYDSTGNQVTSGNLNSPIAAYAVGSAVVRAGDVQGALFGASPNPTATSTASSSWSVEQWTGFSHYPLATGPSNIKTLSQTHPTAVIGSSDETLGQFIANFPNDPAHDTNAAFQNLYQVRLLTANSAGSFQTHAYDELDVLVSGTTWTQVYPTVATSTTTTLAASQNPTTPGTAIMLTATETPATPGSVQFTDGGTNLGSPVAVNASGVATLSQSFSTTGTHSLSAVFTPTDTTQFSGSTGTLSLTVAGMIVTTTSLPNAPVWTSYKQTLHEQGGKCTCHWSVNGGALPAGVKLSSAGAITGTPTTVGTSTFTVTVTDSSKPAKTATATLSITVVPMTVNTGGVPTTGTLGKAYKGTFTATGGKGTKVWSLASGTLPTGLKLSAAGVLSGTPKAAGGYTFTVSVHDAATPHNVATATVTVTIS